VFRAEELKRAIAFSKPEFDVADHWLIATMESFELLVWRIVLKKLENE
jgi:hypothetical protein